MIENTTVVGVFNNMGTLHSDPCNSKLLVGFLCEKYYLAYMQRYIFQVNITSLLTWNPEKRIWTQNGC